MPTDIFCIPICMGMIVLPMEIHTFSLCFAHFTSFVKDNIFSCLETSVLSSEAKGFPILRSLSFYSRSPWPGIGETTRTFFIRTSYMESFSLFRYDVTQLTGEKRYRLQNIIISLTVRFKVMCLTFNLLNIILHH